uniref:Protein kinase domain-containing protein n=1 Tax=Heterorhabditis bacteriophora TaxID=37862 RepID=A0A1I7XE92_HETBA
MSEDELPEEFVELSAGTLIRETWAVIRPLGSGAYGHVYHVINVKDDSQAALKVESKNAVDHVLKIELEVLQNFKGRPDTMQLIAFGTTDAHSFIVMTLCGADLTHLSSSIGAFSDSTVLRLSICTLLSLKSLHEIGYVHRDVKPCNFAISTINKKIVYVIDFGMTRRYASKGDNKQWYIKKRRTKGRVDDLWSWAYMCIEFREALPWRKMIRPEQVESAKEGISDEKLCGIGIMSVFVPILTHLRRLTYCDRPDYKFIFETIGKEINSRNFRLTDPMDWDGKNNENEGLNEKINEGEFMTEITFYEKLGIKRERFSFKRREFNDVSSESGEWVRSLRVFRKYS